ncbi:MAG: hypothetical protein Q9227_006678 [Pyrenula ochraceoflavens]
MDQCFDQNVLDYHDWLDFSAFEASFEPIEASNDLLDSVSFEDPSFSHENNAGPTEPAVQPNVTKESFLSESLLTPSSASDTLLASTKISRKRPFAPPSPVSSPAPVGLGTEPPPPKKQSKWSPEEDALIMQLRNDGMKWQDISRHIHQWDEEKSNKMGRLYERFKREMWSKIAEELSVSWRTAEAMHWKLGEAEMARRATIVPFAVEKKGFASSLSNQSKGNGRSGGRFYLTVKQQGVLRTWLKNHLHDPYPSPLMKSELARQTSLTVRQVEIWFANARKRSQKEQSQIKSSTPNDVSPHQKGSPLARYLSSSEEEEAANPEDIARALTDSNSRSFSTESSPALQNTFPLATDTILSQGAPQPLPCSRAGSVSSAGSAASFGPRQGRRIYGSYSPAHAGHLNTLSQEESSFAYLPYSPHPAHSPAPERPYPCSYCEYRGKTAYDCRRHENSLHNGTTKWVCRLHEIDLLSEPVDSKIRQQQSLKVSFLEAESGAELDTYK